MLTFSYNLGSLLIPVTKLVRRDLPGLCELASPGADGAERFPALSLAFCSALLLSWSSLAGSSPAMRVEQSLL